MATDVVLPKLGPSTEKGTLAIWCVGDGAQVEAGQGLFLLESDGSSNEVPSPATGTLKLLKRAGEDYPEGTVVAIIE